MSDVMMKALQIQSESLTRQVETLVLENERVRKLLTEFDLRHDADQAEIERLRDRLEWIEMRTATAEGLSPEECMQIHIHANVREDWADDQESGADQSGDDDQPEF